MTLLVKKILDYYWNKCRCIQIKLNNNIECAFLQFLLTELYSYIIVNYNLRVRIWHTRFHFILISMFKTVCMEAENIFFLVLTRNFSHINNCQSYGMVQNHNVRSYGTTIHFRSCWWLMINIELYDFHANLSVCILKRKDFFVKSDFLKDRGVIGLLRQSTRSPVTAPAVPCSRSQKQRVDER